MMDTRKLMVDGLLEYIGQAGEKGTLVDLDYLESTGVQWIDTLYLHKSPTVYEVECRGKPGVNGRVFGAGNAGWTNNQNISLGLDGSYYYPKYNESFTATRYPTNDFVYSWHTYTLNGVDGNASFSIDGQAMETKSFVMPDMLPGRTIGLFAWHSNQLFTAGEAKNLQIRRFTIKYAGKVVRDFVPKLRLEDNKPGMYDKIGRKFYTNKGTGADFVYPDIPYDGLVFYDPLDKLYDVIPTGQQMDYASELTSSRITMLEGIPCTDLSGDVVSDTYSITTRSVIKELSTGPVTMSLWLYPDGNTSASDLFYIGRHPHSARYMFHYTAASRNNAGFSYNTSTTATSPNGAVPQNAWSHLVGCLDENMHAYIYVNGVLQATSTIVDRTNDASAYVTIGCYGRSGQGTWRWHNAHVAKARIYNRMLTQAEITKLAQELSPTQE